MTKIDLTVIPDRLERTIQRARERNIIVPTFAEMRNPSLIPMSIQKELTQIGLWDVHPHNLFRITWKNQPVSHGGGFNGVNYLEIPPSLSGVPVRILALVGKWFPTGAHKVGAAFGCLVPRLVTGQFDPTQQKAVWPSTGNYCRGGAYDSALLACESIAILPEGMSRERFEWLSKIAGEVIPTPGTESNVKEIFDKCWELRRSGEELMIFNQFDEFGNYLWHYNVTGHAIKEVLEKELKPADNFRGIALTTGSAGTIACGDFLKQIYPGIKVTASEALQCPTLLLNGFGSHRIEGIGDKHVPWIHNVTNTDLITAIDDNSVVNISRLFNEKAGQEYLLKKGIPLNLIQKLDLFGFSSIANLLSTIKMAKYFEFGEHDVLVTVLTDSMELYTSRLREYHEESGLFTLEDAAEVYARDLIGERTDNLLELSHSERKRIHNLKYYTWVEQQAKTYEEIQAQWYSPDYWDEIQGQTKDIDALIVEFNRRTGLLN